MPNLYAHYLTAARALARLDDAALADAIEQQRPAYNLGAQGPDIFYFHRSWPWTPSGRLHKVADLLHTAHIAEVYRAGVAYIRAADQEQRSTLTAYLCGYAQHHALDAGAHPYVLYHTGDYHLPGAAGRANSRAHARFEVALDTHMLRLETGKQPAWLIGRRLLAVAPPAAQAIGEFWQGVLAEVYGRNVSPAHVREAIADAQSISALLLDSGPSPRWLLVLLVAALDRSGRLHSVRYRRTAAHGSKDLNLAYQPWLLPWDDSIVQTASFPDLIDAAAVVGGRKIQALAAAVAPWTALQGRRGGEPDAVLDDNRSFDSGLDWRRRQDLKFFAPVRR